MTGMAFSMMILAFNSVEIRDDVVAEVAASVRELTGRSAFPVLRLELQSGESYDKAANLATSLGGSTDPARLGTRAEIPMYCDRKRNSVLRASSNLRCVLFAGAAFCVALSRTHAEDTVVVRDRGKDVTVSDLAGVSYGDALAIVEKLQPEWSLKRYPQPSGRMGSFIHYWRPGKDETLLDYYRAGLRDLLEHYVLSVVFDRFVELHPDNGGSYDKSKLEVYLDDLANVDDRFNRIVVDGLSKGLDNNQIDQHLAEAFPNLPKQLAAQEPSIAIASLAGLCREERPYFLIRCQCFPPRVSGRPALWIRSKALNMVAMDHMRAEWKANRERYINVLAQKNGKGRFLVFQSVDGKSLDICGAMSSELTTRSGGVALGGVDLAQEVLVRLGSPTRILVVEDRCQALLGDLARTIHIRQITPVNESLMVYQVGPAELATDYLRFLRSKEADQGSFMEVIGEVVVRPVVQQVLAEMEETEFKLPGIDALATGFGRGHVPKRLYGYEFPQFQMEDVKR